MSNPEDPPPPKDPAAPVDATTTDELYGTTPRVDAATTDELYSTPPVSGEVSATTSRTTIVEANEPSAANVDMRDAIGGRTSRSTIVDANKPSAANVDMRDTIGAPTSRSTIVDANEPSAANVDLREAVGAPISRSTLVDSDEPVLASTVDMREAVGAPTKKAKPAEPDESDPARRSRRTMTIAALAIITGLIIATMIFLGRANSQRYLITCTTDQVRAEQGRAFPPWGSQLLGGAEYKPIALPANAECKALETDDVAELDRQYLSVLLERASATLTAPQLDAPGKPLDVAERQLHQALLLTRAPERRDQRKEVERLLGDVQYWRASLRLRDASVALSDAAKQFDAAAAQRPRHVTDAAAWGSFLKRLADEIKAGPNGVPAVTAPAATTPTTTTSSAVPGTALPVEPEPTVQPPETTPDAGVPTGGVLL